MSFRRASVWRGFEPKFVSVFCVNLLPTVLPFSCPLWTHYLSRLFFFHSMPNYLKNYKKKKTRSEQPNPFFISKIHYFILSPMGFRRGTVWRGFEPKFISVLCVKICCLQFRLLVFHFVHTISQNFFFTWPCQNAVPSKNYLSKPSQFFFKKSSSQNLRNICISHLSWPNSLFPFVPNGLS